MLKIGIVGLSRVGKTTLFQILTRARGTGLGTGRPEAHVGVVRVPDARLGRLVAMHPGRKATHATVEFMDTPGSIIELARTGTFAQGLHEMNEFAHVVRAFEDQTLPPEGGCVNPQGDIENVELELILSDLAVIERRMDKLEKDLKKQKSPALEKERHVLQTCKAALEKQKPLREIELMPDEEPMIRGYTFLSLKPALYVLNLGEKDAARANAADEFAGEAGLKKRPRTAVSAICGKLEAELAELSEADAAEFLASYGLKESGVDRLIHASFHLLGLVCFFTIGDNECRAWTIRAGTTAWEAAGEVHSDFQRGFIRAEVVKFEDLIAAGSLAEARTHAQLKLEGKDYIVRDGDVVYFRHSG